MTIFKNQCKAEALRMLRNPYYIFWSLLMPIIFYVIYTKVFNTGMEDQNEWNAYFLMSMATFSVMGSSIMTLGIRMVQEKAMGWTQYVRVTPLSSLTYYSAKMVGQSLVHFFSIIVIFAAGFFINGVTLPALEWVFSAGWILIASLPFLAMGTLVGLMNKVETASGVSNLIYLGLAITGGMWMPMEFLPTIVQKFGVWLPSFNFGNGAWQIVQGNAPELRNFLILAAYLVLFMVLSIYIRKRQEAV